MGQGAVRVSTGGAVYRTRTLADERDFLALEAAWNELEAASGNTNVFLRFDWVATWWRHFGHGRRLAVVNVEKGDRLVAAAPLMLAVAGGVRTIGFLGRPGADYADVLVLPGEQACVAEIVTCLERRGGWDRLNLSGVPDDSPNFVTLAALWAKRRGMRSAIVYPAPYLQIRTTWEEYYDGLDRDHRGDTARQLRRLGALGEVRLEPCRDLGEVAQVVERIITQKRTRFQRGAGLYRDPRWLAFYRDLGEQGLRAGWLDVSRLMVGASEVALHFGFVYQGRFSYYLPSFDPEFERFSVGRLLLLSLLERAHQEKLDEFDFMGGREAYKYVWTQQERQIYRFAADRTFRGRVLSVVAEGPVAALRRASWLRRAARWYRGR